MFYILYNLLDETEAKLNLHCSLVHLFLSPPTAPPTSSHSSNDCLQVLAHLFIHILALTLIILCWLESVHSPLAQLYLPLDELKPPCVEFEKLTTLAPLAVVL